MTDWPTFATGPGYQGFFSDFDTTFWSAVLRIGQALVAAAPFLVAGVFAAGFLRGFVGADRIRKILGIGRWSGPLRAWALGVLLPVCALGALPVARELRRAGVPSGTVLSFVLVAPVLNPLSIVYGLSHITPIMLVYFMAGTFLVSVGIGVIWNRLVAEKRDIDPGELESAPRDALVRLATVGDTAARALVGPVFIDFLLALLAVGFLGAFLPHGVLQTGLTRDNPLAPFFMGLVAIPVYVTPIDVMMHFGHIVQDGYSLGAAFALIVLGAGSNVGVANWLRRDYGLRPLLLFIAMLIGTTLIIGVTADRALIVGNATMEDHTHAFDSFTRLSNVAAEDANFSWVVSKITTKLRPHERIGIQLLLAIIGVGILLRLLGDRVNLDRLRAREQTSAAPVANTGWNRALTPRQLILCGVIGVLALGTYFLYIFYPPPPLLIGEMNDIRVDLYEAIREKDAQEAKRRLDQWRSQIGKLPTCVLIRNGSVSDELREQVAEVEKTFDALEQYIDAGRFDEAATMIRYVEGVYKKCCKAARTHETSR